MLRSDRIALDAQIEHARLNIQERDLNNVTTFLDGLATQSALLAGFAFVAFSSYEKVETWKVVLLYLSTCCALGSNLFVLCVGQLVTIYGPTLALKGPKGSMERAVNLMRYYRTIIFWMFAFGLVSFAWMIIMLLFIYLPDNLVGLLVPCLVIISVFFLFTFADFRSISYVTKTNIIATKTLTLTNKKYVIHAANNRLINKDIFPNFKLNGRGVSKYKYPTSNIPMIIGIESLFFKSLPEVIIIYIKYLFII